MTIFFDLDGTLVDISSRHYAVYQRCTIKFGGRELSKNDYWQNKRNNMPWGEILALSDIPTGEKSHFMDMFVEFIESPEYLKMDRLFSSSLKTLKYVSLGNKLVLVSFRRKRNELLQQLKDLKIDRYFDLILSGHAETKTSVLDKKSHIIQERCTVKAEDIIIGDTEADVSAGKLLRIHTVCVTSGIRNKDYLQGFSPEFIVASVEELPRVIDHIKE